MAHLSYKNFSNLQREYSIILVNRINLNFTSALKFANQKCTIDHHVFMKLETIRVPRVKKFL